MNKRHFGGGTIVDSIAIRFDSGPMLVDVLTAACF